MTLTVRYVIFIISAMGSVVWLVISRKIGFGYTFAVLAWLINLCAFHVVRIIVLTKMFNVPAYLSDVTFINNWSIAIQLQGTLTLTLLGFALLSWSRKWK